MSSIDQAFVKAFARRSRPTRDASQTSAEKSNSENQDVGQLQVDPSVSQTAKVWIDTDGDRMLRTDAAAEHIVPEPHVLEPTPIRPAEHFRCDYVFGAIEEVLPTDETEAADAETVELPSAEPSDNEVVVDDRDVSVSTSELDTASDVAAKKSIDSVENTPQISEDAETDVTSEPTGIQAAWEVDMFEIPATTADLFFDEDFFQGIANRMRDAVNDGLNSLVVTSAQSGEGRSTVAIGVAIAAAATGLKVALVDGDSEDPTLADDLRLDLEYGWIEAIRGTTPIDQIAVQSIQDGVTLFPLIPAKADSGSASADEVGTLMETLRGQFDLVVIDGPTCAMPRLQQFAALVDTAIITRDASRTDDNTINELSARLQQSGVQGVGVVENFS